MTIYALIREFLLQEEVFGAQAFVYHGSQTPHYDFLPILINDKFVPGKGSGSLYGKGLYTVYNLENSSTGEGIYGEWIYKLKVNLYGFISFNPDITRKIYKKDMTPAEQAQLVGADSDVVEELQKYKPGPLGQSTSHEVVKFVKYLSGQVKGIIYTGDNDGDCALIYDVSVVTPVAYTNLDWRSGIWEKVDRESIKPSLRRSSTGEWEKQKYEMPVALLMKRLSSLPEERRKFNGDVNLKLVNDVYLPDGLTIGGDLRLSSSNLDKLPSRLSVEGSLFVQYSNITSIPKDIFIGADLDISHSLVSSIPNDFNINGSLIASHCKLLRKLPRNLEIAEDCILSYSSLASLPEGLTVVGDLKFHGTAIVSLPSDLDVGGKIYGLPDFAKANVPKHLKTKIQL